MKMKSRTKVCSICNSNESTLISISDGHICESCYNKLIPFFRETIKQNPDRISKKNILDIFKVFKPVTSTNFWYENSNLKVSEKSIVLWNCEIAFSDILKFSWSYLPTSAVDLKHVKGYFQCYFQFESFYADLDIFEKDYVCEYKSGRKERMFAPTEVIFVYKYPFEEFYILASLEDIISSKDYDKVFDIKANYEFIRNDNKTATEQKEQSRLEKALELYQLDIDVPFTMDQLRARRKQLMKKYHPDLWLDNPEMEEKAKSVTEAYDILKNFCQK